MTRCLGASVAVLALLGAAHAHVQFAADLPVGPYLADPARDERAPYHPNFGGAPATPLLRSEPQRPHEPPTDAARPLHEPPTSAAAPRDRPSDMAPLLPQTPAHVPPELEVATPGPAEPGRSPATAQGAESRSFLPFSFVVVVLLLAGFAGSITYWLLGPTETGNGSGPHGAASEIKPPSVGGDAGHAVSSANTGAVTTRTELPNQDGWAQRASDVRDPVSGLVFKFQARANARAMAEEQQRVKAARGVLKEYAGMFKDLVEGQEAATAYGVRRDLAGDFHEHERSKAGDAFEESAHRRRLARKRRDKETIEADTRTIEAQHEQEALERFKEAKFQAGFARFEAKAKEHLVGAATAEAAIAETKAPEQPSDPSGNESAEVAMLYTLLQATLREIEERERLGRDTQPMRDRLDLYKKLLNLT